MELLADLSWDSIANRDNREEYANEFNEIAIITRTWNSNICKQAERFLPLEYEFMDELVQLVDRDKQSETQIMKPKLILQLNLYKQTSKFKIYIF